MPTLNQRIHKMRPNKSGAAGNKYGTALKGLPEKIGVIDHSVGESEAFGVPAAGGSCRAQRAPQHLAPMCEPGSHELEQALARRHVDRRRLTADELDEHSRRAIAVIV